MTSLLVAVKSCKRDREAGFHHAIRETWGRDLKALGVPVIFFEGHSASQYFMAHPEGKAVGTLLRDEATVDSADDYAALPHKTRGICGWASAKMFSHIFLCDNDTFVNAKALVSLPFELFDYGGHFKGGQEEIGTPFFYKDHTGEYPNCQPWASGGMGYFLSKAATALVADTYPRVWAEDMFVGQVIGKEIQQGRMQAIALNMNRNATWHFRKSEKHPSFTPELLRRIYADGSPEKLYADN